MEKRIQLFRLKLFLAALFGVFFCTFAGDIVTVHAMQTQQEQTIYEEQVPLSEEPEESGAGAFLLIGGFIIIIMAVLIAVISTFISTAAISDEL